MDINTLVVYRELDEVIKWIEKQPVDSVFEFKERYVVLREFAHTTKDKNGRIIKVKQYKRGDEILLKPSMATPSVKLKEGFSANRDDIRKIKQYLDFKSGPYLRDVTFSKDFTKLKIH